MHDVMRKRIMRKLEALPDDRLYQVLDYVDFLESRYAPGRAPEPSGFQRFAERLEDGMRGRTLGPRMIGGAMEWVGAAGRVLDEIAATGRDLVSAATPRPPETGSGGPGAASAGNAGSWTSADRGEGKEPGEEPSSG